MLFFNRPSVLSTTHVSERQKATCIFVQVCSRPTLQSVRLNGEWIAKGAVGLFLSALITSPLALAQPISGSILETEVEPDSITDIVTPDSASGFKRAAYISLGTGVSLLDPDVSPGQPLDFDDEAQLGVQLGIGVDLHERFSLELHMADLGSADFSNGSSISYQQYGLSTLFYFRESRKRYNREGWTFYGRGGLGKFQNDSKGDVAYERADDSHLVLGAGVEVARKSGLAFRAEAMAFDSAAAYAQVGVLYRFGGSKLQRFGASDVHPTVREQMDRMSGRSERVPGPNDQDGDGILGESDRCPDTPSRVAVGRDGCAVFSDVTDGLTFVSGSAELTPGAEEVLDTVVQFMNDIPQTRAQISSHTDSSGSADANMQLSQDRALAVARYLVQGGVSKDRLRALAFGETRPIDTNATAEGRNNNRRVEIRLIAE